MQTECEAGVSGRAALVGLCVAIGGFLGSAGTARAGDTCYLASSAHYYSDMCATQTNGQAYESARALSSFFTAQNGASYLLACSNSAVEVYDAANPAIMATPLATLRIPWDWNDIGGTDDHSYQYQHILDVATVDDAQFPYAVVSLGNYGWDFLKLNGAGSKFLGNGYEPVSVLGVPRLYSKTAVFSANGDVYVVGQALDAASISVSDPSLRIYHIGGNGVSPDTLSWSTMDQGIPVPIGHPGDVFDDTQFPLSTSLRPYVLVDDSGHRVLLVDGGSQAAVVNIDTPTAPSPLEVNTQTGIAGGAAWAVDPVRHVLWVASSSQTVVNGYLVATDHAPGLSSLELQVPYTNVNYDAADAAAANTTGGMSGVAVSGDLLTAWAVTSGASSYQDRSRIGYVNLAGPEPVLLGAAVPYTSLDLTRSCANSAYYEAVENVRPFQVNGSDYASLSLEVDFELVQLDPACMGKTGSDGGSAEQDASMQDGGADAADEAFDSGMPDTGGAGGETAQGGSAGPQAQTAGACACGFGARATSGAWALCGAVAVLGIVRRKRRRR